MKKITFCSLCGASQFFTLFSVKDRMFDLPGLFAYKKCRNCQLVFLDPQPTSAELKLYYPSSRYYSYNIDETKGFFGGLREYLVNHYYKPSFLSKAFTSLIQNVPGLPKSSKFGKSRRLLDVGYGTGDTMLMLKNLGWDVYGLDIDKKAFQYAKKRGLKKVQLGTYKTIVKYADGFFDVVRLYHVIEHLNNPRHCLKLIKRKLKKGGELIIGTPNMSSFVSKRFRNYWYNLDAPRHLFLFADKTLKEMAEEEGFRVTSLEFCSAGGIVGSFQYILNDLFKKRVNLIGKVWLVVLFYPFEWLLNKLHQGDIFIMRMQAKEK